MIPDLAFLGPLPELHLHLDGSLRLDTLKALAEDQGAELPGRDLRFTPGMSLRAALERFEITLGVLQRPEAVRRVADEICQDAAAQGVTTLELRFAPQLHRGAPPEEIIDAALDGLAGRAGLILCGLYGEPPAVLEGHVEAARLRPGVVGVDLAGGPSSGDRFRLQDYAPAFAQARALGLGRTVHAGEGRPPQEIRVAVEALHAQRIGHGTTLLEESTIVDLLLERGVTVEACLSSNLHTGAIASLSAHPLRRWIELGVEVCVCADNALFSDTTAANELTLARDHCGLSQSDLRAAVASGHAAKFVR